MKARLVALLTIVVAPSFSMSGVPNTLTREDAAAGWQLLFDGRTLEGWRPSDQPGTFSVKDGTIVAHGPRSHLYYVGSVHNHDFHNFELELEVMTFPQANSGVYFHTQWQDSGFPRTGREIQVNNSHGDPSRTGGLYGVQTNYESPVKDLVWFTLRITVNTGHVMTAVDGKPIVDYHRQPATQQGADPQVRFLEGGGTFALQGHDPESQVHFRNIRVRVLQ